MAEHEHIN